MLETFKKFFPSKNPIKEATDNHSMFTNKYGYYDDMRKEYIIHHNLDVVTPRPWSNVMANKKFGTIVTDSTLGATWFDNSKDKRISFWSNDPVSDTPSEIVYVKSLDDGTTWSATPNPIRLQEDTWTTYHGIGYTKYEMQNKDLHQTLTVCVDKELPVKTVSLLLDNKTNRQKEFSIYYFVDVVYGNFKNQFDSFVDISYSSELNSLIAQRVDKPTHDKLVFISSNETIVSTTTNYNAFVGYLHDLTNPVGIAATDLNDLPSLPQRNCAVIEVRVKLQPAEVKKLEFFVGAASKNEVQELVTAFRSVERTDRSLQEVKDFWASINSHVTITTPDPTINVLFNNWLLYQTLSCRFWGRSSFYQSSGAFGFRDQLQDSLAFLYSCPEITREHILRCAGRQYEEGDVQHWWFDDTSIGVRNTIADSPLWLAYAVHHYVEKTGDLSLLEVEVPFIKGRPTSEAEPAYVSIPEISEQKGTIWEHCLRSIHKVAVFGEHGLPLMKEGDWNDGMNHVGIKGNGESVWLGWFMTYILKKFITLAETRTDTDTVQRFQNLLDKLVSSLHENTWDGEWYKRAFFDDGSPLGSRKNVDCQIDSISQSWAVIADVDFKERLHKAMESGLKHLVDEDLGLVRLLYPAFNKGPENPGYIKNYVPGIRENGGQYNHAVYWFIMALGKLKMGERALDIMNFTNPFKKTETEDALERYGLEPYVVAGDIYASHQHPGRGGWSWYSASSGLMYRSILICILGFRLYNNKIHFNPSVPKHWKEYTINYHYKSSEYNIRYIIAPGHTNAVTKVSLDGIPKATDTLELNDDGKKHKVEVYVN